jgi:hypothetical protein
MIKAKLYMNVHWMVLYKLYVFCSDISRHFEFHIGTKNLKIVEDHPMNIHVQFGFNHIMHSSQKLEIRLKPKCT